MSGARKLRSWSSLLVAAVRGVGAVRTGRSACRCAGVFEVRAVSVGHFAGAGGSRFADPLHRRIKLDDDSLLGTVF